MLEKGKKMNIPVYRAKMIDSDGYVVGFLFDALLVYSTNKDLIPLYRLWIKNKDGDFEIDPRTLSIHFEDMLDSQGNKIFASLSEDGKGGDIMKDDEYYGIAKYKDSRFVVEYENVEECLYEGNFEVIGMQE